MGKSDYHWSCPGFQANIDYLCHPELVSGSVHAGQADGSCGFFMVHHSVFVDVETSSGQTQYAAVRRQLILAESVPIK